MLETRRAHFWSRSQNPELHLVQVPKLGPPPPQKRLDRLVPSVMLREVGLITVVVNVTSEQPNVPLINGKAKRGVLGLQFPSQSRLTATWKSHHQVKRCHRKRPIPRDYSSSRRCALRQPAVLGLALRNRKMVHRLGEHLREPSEAGSGVSRAHGVPLVGVRCRGHLEAPTSGQSSPRHAGREMSAFQPNHPESGSSASGPKADEQQCASYRPFTTADTIPENGKFACKVRSKTRIRTRRDTGFEVLNIL